MVTRDVRGDGKGAIAARSRLRSKLAELSEAECAEVIEYIEVMRSLRCEAADRRLFGDGFARRGRLRARRRRSLPLPALAL